MNLRNISQLDNKSIQNSPRRLGREAWILLCEKCCRLWSYRREKRLIDKIITSQKEYHFSQKKIGEDKGKEPHFW